MKHLKKGRKFGRVKNQRQAMLKTLLGSLIMREKIQTTEARAKEIKGKIDEIITKGKKTKDANRKVSIMRQLQNELPAAAAKKITGGFLEKFSGRTSGYTRIIRLTPRKSDSARLAIIEFVQ